jgi:hypothetical protein
MGQWKGGKYGTKTFCKDGRISNMLFAMLKKIIQTRRKD